MSIKANIITTPTPVGTQADRAVHGRMYETSNGSRVLCLHNYSSRFFINVGSTKQDSGSAFHDVGFVFTSVSSPLTELPKGSTFVVTQE